MDEKYLEYLKCLDSIVGPQLLCSKYRTEKDFLVSAVKGMSWRQLETQKKAIKRWEAKHSDWQTFIDTSLVEESPELQAEGQELQAAQAAVAAWSKLGKSWRKIWSPETAYTQATAAMYHPKYEVYLETLHKIAGPLIQSGIYATEADFLKDLLKDYAQRQLELEQKVVLGFEKQYISWEKFSDALMNIATPLQEDEWMEWEAAREGVKAWQETLDELS